MDTAELVDMAADMSHSARSGKGRARGGKRGGGGGARDQGRDVQISKALSKLLRHAAEDVGLRLDMEGFARVDEVLKWQRLRSLKTSFSDIQTAVTDNAKQRFTMKPNPETTPTPESNDIDPSHWLIRANQGHTIALDSAALLKPITLEAGNHPEFVIHGTYYGLYTAILESGGLKKMDRNHVHFSVGLPGKEIISGMRSDAELFIYIDIKKSLEDRAMLWWLSDNGVVLTEGDENGLVPTKYWKRVEARHQVEARSQDGDVLWVEGKKQDGGVLWVEGRNQDVGVLWVDGVEVAELPQRLKGKRVPIGKGQIAKSKGKGSQRDGRKPGEEMTALGEEAS